MSADRDDQQIVPSSALVIYAPPAQFTNKTPVFTPLFLPALRFIAVMGIEWTTLYFIETAPFIVRIATLVDRI